MKSQPLKSEVSVKRSRRAIHIAARGPISSKLIDN